MIYETIEQWRDEFYKLQECRKAFEGPPLSNAYNGQDSYAKVNALLNEIVSLHGMERVKIVLAHTVREQSWDGRFCTAVKNWADKSEPFAQPPIRDEYSERPCRQYHELTINKHPAILNDVIRLIIKGERQLEEKNHAMPKCKDDQVR